MSKGFKKDIKSGVAIGLGAGFMDFIYILIAYGGFSIVKSLLPESANNFLGENERYIKIFLTFAGCIIVIIYGFKIMKMKVLNGNYNSGNLAVEKLESVLEEKAESKLIKTEIELDKILHTQALEKEKSGITGNFLTGVLLCLSSVTLPASWIAIVSYLQSYRVIDSSFITGFALAIGVLIGTTVWFYTLTNFISRNTHKINPEKLNKLNISVGILLILLGLFLFYKAIDFAIIII